eukprot:SAG31_NODE_10980_length_1076_cov_1.170931_1_plen_63_part_00
MESESRGGLDDEIVLMTRKAEHTRESIYCDSLGKKELPESVARMPPGIKPLQPACFAAAVKY